MSTFSCCCSNCNLSLRATHLAWPGVQHEAPRSTMSRKINQPGCSVIEKDTMIGPGALHSHKWIHSTPRTYTQYIKWSVPPGAASSGRHGPAYLRGSVAMAAATSATAAGSPPPCPLLPLLRPPDPLPLPCFDFLPPPLLAPRDVLPSCAPGAVAWAFAATSAPRSAIRCLQLRREKHSTASLHGVLVRFCAFGVIHKPKATSSRHQGHTCGSESRDCCI